MEFKNKNIALKYITVNFIKEGSIVSADDACVRHTPGKNERYGDRRTVQKDKILQNMR